MFNIGAIGEATLFATSGSESILKSALALHQLGIPRRALHPQLTLHEA
jgi:hypothetical protein